VVAAERSEQQCPGVGSFAVRQVVQAVHTVQQQHGVAEPRFPEGARKLIQGAGARRSREVEGEQRQAAGPGQRLGGQPLAGAARPLEVQSKRPAGLPRLESEARQRAPGGGRERLLGQRDGQLDQIAVLREPSVEGGVAQQQVDDLVVELQDAGEQRRLDGARVGNQVEQAVATERRIGPQVGAPGEPGGWRVAEQVERQVDGGPAAGDVVLEVGVQALVAEVDLRRQRNQDEIEVEAGQVERIPEPVPGTGAELARRLLSWQDKLAVMPQVVAGCRADGVCVQRRAAGLPG
jgi:hypothetical protein